MFLCMSNFSVTHAVSCTVTISLSESESWPGKKKALFAKCTSLCSCSWASFNCSTLDGAAAESHWGPWSAKTGFRVAAEVASLLAEIGGFYRLRYFFCSHFATAVLTTSFASSVETAEPFIDTCSNVDVDLQTVFHSHFDPFNLTCTPFWPSIGD